MNACFKYSYFPTAWKQANVIPILEPGKDPFDPKSHRVTISKFIQTMVTAIRTKVMKKVVGKLTLK
jgi:hypothetical protein